MSRLKVTCPKDPTHESFSVIAHVSELWRVDNSAEFIEMIESGMDTVHRPDSQDSYTCTECDTPATVEVIYGDTRTQPIRE